MNKIFTLIFAIISSLSVSAQFSSSNVFLSKNIDPFTGEPSFLGSKYSSVWGYADTVNNKEYAILGAAGGTYFIDVTDPSVDGTILFLPGARKKCLWREYKTYKNYLYAVSDDSDNDTNSLQIVDLSYLPDSIHVVHDADSIIKRSHTIFVDGDKLYGGNVTTPTTFYPMAVYNLENPALPKLIRTLDQDYPAISLVHDMLVRNDTVFASCGTFGLFVYKFDPNSSNPKFNMLGSLTNYPEQGYNHSTALSRDGKKLVMCDETDSMGVKVLDVSDLSDITVSSIFRSNIGAMAHNPYMKDNDLVIIASYMDGLQIYDISNPLLPVNIGYFDTYPENGTSFPPETYRGNWGAYIHLPSGRILASDMQRGLFVLSAPGIMGVKEVNKSSTEFIYPNPFSDVIHIKMQQAISEIVLSDVLGKIVLVKKFSEPSKEIRMDELSGIAAGAYFLSVKSKEATKTFKVLK